MAAAESSFARATYLFLISRDECPNSLWRTYTLPRFAKLDGKGVSELVRMRLCHTSVNPYTVQ